MEAVQNASEFLCANISETLDLIGALTALSKEKEAFLSAGDIEGLRASTEKEEEIVLALSRKEKDRKLCADALSQAIGLFHKDATLKDIIDRLTDTAMKERLSALRQQLMAAADNLSQQNDKLGQLLQLRIGLTDYMINLLYLPKKKNHTYDIQGSRRDDNGNPSLFDLHI